jgi:hypothetical protein
VRDEVLDGAREAKCERRERGLALTKFLLGNSSACSGEAYKVTEATFASSHSLVICCLTHEAAGAARAWLALSWLLSLCFDTARTRVGLLGRKSFVIPLLCYSGTGRCSACLVEQLYPSLTLAAADHLGPLRSCRRACCSLMVVSLWWS